MPIRRYEYVDQTTKNIVRIQDLITVSKADNHDQLLHTTSGLYQYLQQIVDSLSLFRAGENEAADRHMDCCYAAIRDLEDNFFQSSVGQTQDELQHSIFYVAQCYSFDSHKFPNQDCVDVMSILHQALYLVVSENGIELLKSAEGETLLHRMCSLDGQIRYHQDLAIDGDHWQLMRHCEMALKEAAYRMLGYTRPQDEQFDILIERANRGSVVNFRKLVSKGEELDDRDGQWIKVRQMLWAVEGWNA